MAKKLAPWLAGLKKNGTTSSLQKNETHQCLAVSGSQGSTYLSAAYNAVDIAQMIAITNANSGPGKPETKRIVLESCQVVSYITNAGTNPMSFDIYDLVARHDMTEQGLSGPNEPIAIWDIGMTQQGTGTGTTNVVGVTPFQSPAFCQAWLVKRVSKVQLAQGATHEHRASIRPNLNFNNARTTEGNQWYKNMSYISFVVARGFPVDQGAGVSLQISTAPAQLDIITSYKYEMTSISDITSYASIKDNLTRLETPNIVNIGDGKIEPVQFQ